MASKKGLRDVKDLLKPVTKDASEPPESKAPQKPDLRHSKQYQNVKDLLKPVVKDAAEEEGSSPDLRDMLGKFKAPEKKAEPPKEEPKKEEPKEEEPKPAKKTGSNVFAMFPQAQIQEFKEAFQMMDADRDGLIGVDDLLAMYQNLGRDPSKKELEEMLKEVPGQLNFTAFLTLFGEKLHGSDSESKLHDAFELFDPQKKGTLADDYLKDLLTNMGDNFSAAELKQMWKEAPVEGGQFDYQKYTILIKRGNQDEQ